MSATTTQYLDTTGLTTFWGNLKKRITFHNMSGDAGTAGYVNFLKVKCATYINHPLVVHILSRGYSSSTMEVQFQSDDTTLSRIAYFRHSIQSYSGTAGTTSNVGYTYEDVDGIRYYKFWKKKNEGWGSVAVHVDDDSIFVSNGLISFPGELSTTEPANIVWATYVWDSVPSVTSTAASAKKIGCNAQGQVVFGDALTAGDVGAAPTSHASSATTYGVGTTANYGHVKLDNSTPLTVGATHVDGVATGKGHKHNNLESVKRSDVSTADIEHVYTNDRAHMFLIQTSNATSATHKPGDGYMLAFNWDNSGAYDAQLFVPASSHAGDDYGRLKIRYRNDSSWGDWGYLSAAHSTVKLTSSDDLNNILGAGGYTIAGYYWLNTSTPANKPLPDVAYGATMVVYQINTNSTTQIVYRAGSGIYTRRESNGTWSAWEKVLVSGDVSVPSTVPTLAWNTESTLATIDGKNIKVKLPASPDTDTKVTQTVDTSNDAAYPLLAKNTTATATITDTSRFTSGVTLNPKNKSITATTFIGALSGNATTATHGAAHAYVRLWNSGQYSASIPYALLAEKTVSTTVNWGFGQLFKLENNERYVIFKINLRGGKTSISSNSDIVQIIYSYGLSSADVNKAVVVTYSYTANATCVVRIYSDLRLLASDWQRVSLRQLDNQAGDVCAFNDWDTFTFYQRTDNTGNVASVTGTPMTNNFSGACFFGTATSATSAGKLTTARTTYVTLGTASTTTTRDWSDTTTIPVSGTLQIGNGGTGQTTALNIVNETIQAGLGTGDGDVSDSTDMVTSHIDGYSSTNKGLYRRKATKLWSYIKGKLTSDTGVNISGNAATANSATKATQDSDGKQINSTYLKLSGGTMTGKITAQAGQYTDDNVTCAINMNNSNIIGLNSIYTADASDGASEGIHFYRDATHVDTLWMAGGALYFVPNRALGTSTSAANSQKVARLPASITDNQVVLTDGTAGALKTSTLDAACNLFINALSTGSSIPTDNDYYVSQYVGGGTTTTSYHRRPVSALWSYIKGKMTSVTGVNISGNAATATSATKVSTTEDTSNYLYILGVDSTDSNFNVIKRDTRLAAYGGKLMFTENSKGNYLGISGGQDASSVYSYLPPSGGTMISVTTQTEINMAITDNYNKVEFNMRKYAGVFAARETPINDYYFYRGLATTTNPSNNIESNIHAGKYTLSEKCTLQFNTTTNALDFVFA